MYEKTVCDIFLWFSATQTIQLFVIKVLQMLGSSSDCHTPDCSNTFSLKSSVLKLIPWMPEESAFAIRQNSNSKLILIFNLNRLLGSFEGIIPDVEVSKTSFQMRKLRKCHSRHRSFADAIPNWRIGRLVDWKIGRLEDWKIGEVEGWKIGRLEDWWIGGLEN